MYCNRSWIRHRPIAAKNGYILQESASFDYQIEAANREAISREVKWINHKNRPIDETVKPITTEEMVSGEYEPQIDKLPFRDPDSFVAGELHRQVKEWESLAQLHTTSDTDKCLGWIRTGIHVNYFMTYFKGEYQGIRFDSYVPPTLYVSKCQSYYAILRIFFPKQP